MKISLFVHSYPPARGGLEYLSQEIYKSLSLRHTVHVFTGKGQTLDSYKTFSDWVNERHDTKTIHRLTLQFFQQRIANKLLQKLIFQVPYVSPWYFGPILDYTREHLSIIQTSDILIGTGFPTKMVTDALLFSKRWQKPLVILPAYHNVSYFNNSPPFQKALNTAQSIICLSDTERTDLSKHYHIDQKKTSVLTFSPYTQQEITRQRKYLRERLKKAQERIESKQITVGYVGQITRRKNLSFLARFIDQYSDTLWSKNLQVRLVLAGTKTNTSGETEKLFETHIRTGQVVIRYNFPKKQEVYEDIDIFMNPSIEESYGIVNMESIYHGCLTVVHTKSPFSSLVHKKHTVSRPAELYQILHDVVDNPKQYQDTILNQYALLENHPRESFDYTLESIISKTSSTRQR
jgi:glycosyltransferase involved in cell wall biosynthesis